MPRDRTEIRKGQFLTNDGSGGRVISIEDLGRDPPQDLAADDTIEQARQKLAAAEIRLQEIRSFLATQK